MIVSRNNILENKFTFFSAKCCSHSFRKSCNIIRRGNLFRQRLYNMIVMHISSIKNKQKCIWWWSDEIAYNIIIHIFYQWCADNRIIYYRVWYCYNNIRWHITTTTATLYRYSALLNNRDDDLGKRVPIAHKTNRVLLVYYYDFYALRNGILRINYW